MRCWRGRDSRDCCAEMRRQGRRAQGIAARRARGPGRDGLLRWGRRSSEGDYAVGVHKGEQLVVDAADDAGASVQEGG